MSKYYAVRIGKHPGVYRTWDECKRETSGVKGAVFKAFTTLEEAENYIHANEKTEEITKERPYAFVDGSYNPDTGVYGYGGFIFYDGHKEVLQGYGSEPDMIIMRNVAGEIQGAVAAVKAAIELGLPEIDIYYDYTGIEFWATGAWKRNKTGTKNYHDFIQSVKGKLKINFVKVKGHSGIEGNEEADRLAKEAVGISE